jgi:dTDP-4-amino-4,6-dideoxygalactose transaminase
MVVHYCGHPADMDAIMDIARRHKVKVIEDVSHAHGGHYKGKMVGTIGDVAAMSLMSGKSLAVGEAGMLVTDDREIYERALAWGHYSRFTDAVETDYLKELVGLPIGGHKNRMHQMSAALGRVQLRHYEERRREILKAMNYFWDLLEGTKGIRAHRVDPKSDSDMGGWYAATGHYVPEELGGLSVTRFTEAVRAEGVSMIRAGANKPLHQHPLLKTYDIYGDGMPTRLRNGNDDVLEIEGSLPVADEIGTRIYKIPWFKHYRPEYIQEYARAFRKVSEHYEELLKDDPGNGVDVGSWGLFLRK